MMWECTGCGVEPCVVNDGAKNVMSCRNAHIRRWVGIEENHKELVSFDDLEFGQEIEINQSGELGWQTVKYAGKMLASSAHLVNDGVHDTFAIGGLQWRLPLKDRIRRGQIMIDPVTTVVWTFVSFTAEGCEVLGSISSDSNVKTKVLKSWRLPKKEELIELGLDGLGWLSEG